MHFDLGRQTHSQLGNVLYFRVLVIWVRTHPGSLIPQPMLITLLYDEESKALGAFLNLDSDYVKVKTFISLPDIRLAHSVMIIRTGVI